MTYVLSSLVSLLLVLHWYLCTVCLDKNNRKGNYKVWFKCSTIRTKGYGNLRLPPTFLPGRIHIQRPNPLKDAGAVHPSVNGSLGPGLQICGRVSTHSTVLNGRKTLSVWWYLVFLCLYFNDQWFDKLLWHWLVCKCCQDVCSAGHLFGL